MFSTDQMNSILTDVIDRLSGMGNSSKDTKDSRRKKITLNPAQALVIVGLLGGVLDVTSLLVDKNQLIQIVVSGSLKQKNQIDKIIDQIGDKTFDEVLKALFERFS